MKRTMAFAVLLVPLFVLLMAPRAGAQQGQSVVNTPHNLSASGPGRIRAAGEQEVCIFCHTPHNASPVQPLWNRSIAPNAYTVYSSNSLQAKPGQPTGSSKLCLSCHDGTIALGSVVSRSQPIQMSGGITTLPPGTSNLGTDLSDDHPISFRYDDALATKRPTLRPPGQLPPNVRRDPNLEMQCTTCHEAHDNTFGSFLVMDNTSSQLCVTCHNQGMTTVLSHQNCNACHASHTAPSGPYLLRKATVSETCLTCHSGGSGTAQGANIAADLAKPVIHDTHSPVNQKNHFPANVDCADCHQPHTMLARGAGPAPSISGRLGRVSGVTSAGATVSFPQGAQYEYEVCFKCHGDQSAVAPKVSRQIVQNNTRLQFAPAAASYHPVEAAGRNADVPSLSPGWTTASIVSCTDCHNSDTGRAAGVGAGVGANGPHGSTYPGLLIAPYDTADRSAESVNTYALCYRCHDRANLLADRSFPTHHLHVVDSQTPCSACHTSHGIASGQGNATNNSNLINFDTAIVQPEPSTNRREFRDTGAFSGSCTLVCHGKTHLDTTYGSGAATPAQLLRSAPRGARVRH